MPLTIEIEQEEDGRWVAEVPAIPGVLAYGQTRDEAIEHIQALRSACSRIGWIMASRIVASG